MKNDDVKSSDPDIVNQRLLDRMTRTYGAEKAQQVYDSMVSEGKIVGGRKQPQGGSKTNANSQG